MLNPNRFSALIADYIQNRKKVKLDDLQKIHHREIRKTEKNSGNLVAIRSKQLQEKIDVTNNFEPQIWLSDAANRTKEGKINLATHAPKYIHSGIRKASGFKVEKKQDDINYLVTEQLDELNTDFVCSNAADLFLASFLSIEVDERKLYQEIAYGNIEPFLPFAESEKQALEWLQGFTQALSPNTIASHALAKQLYFPVYDDYHIISPLFASSLYQQVHETIDAAMFSDEQKAAREAKSKGEFYEVETVSFPDIAVQSFGGTKTQNISQLNTKRYGKAYLLNCGPPNWRTQLQLPTESNNAFWQIYSERAWRKARFLKDYLVKKLNHSSVKAIRDFRGDLIDDLIDLLIATAAEIQNAKEKSGWSKSSKIPEAEKLWLDPYRGCQEGADDEDKEFRETRDANDWQLDIARSFGEWLNRRLRLGDKLNVGDGEYNEWRRLVQKKLARLKHDLEDF